MKFLVTFVVTLAAASAFDLCNAEILPGKEAVGLILNAPVLAAVEEEEYVANAGIPEDPNAEELFSNSPVAVDVAAAADYAVLSEDIPQKLEAEGLFPSDSVAVDIPASADYEELTNNYALSEDAENKELPVNLSIPENIDYDGEDIINDTVNADIEAEDRITNGQYGKDGQIPYQALIILNSGRYSFCGGSLIGRNWVLSAAHCTKYVRSVTVHLGSIVFNRGQVKYTVYRDNIINHHGYTGTDHINDISLIKIPTVTYSSRIQPIRLPSATRNSYIGYTAIASGWGQTETGERSDHLRWARVKVISNAQCRKTFLSLSSSNVCISTYGGVSTCYGDSGGPLVLESSKILIGLTSFGVGDNCIRGAPVAFTRVSSYLNWIKQHTGIYY